MTTAIPKPAAPNPHEFGRNTDTDRGGVGLNRHLSLMDGSSLSLEEELAQVITRFVKAT
jgi:hypothetical protein